MTLKGEIVEITTKDKLELPGILFEPKAKTKTAIIHVHGFVGNFYENKFIGGLAKASINRRVAFLSFNNRGAGIVTEFIRRKNNKVKYVKIGGSLERFEDCIIDLRAAIDFLSRKGYSKIFLQGHSSGCQKITYYQYKTQDKRVKGLILLAPVDDVGYVKRLLGKKYRAALKIVRALIRRGKRTASVPKWIQFYPMLNAGVAFQVIDKESPSGRLFDYSGELREISEVTCPLLAVFGSKDEYEEKPEQKLELLRDKTGCDVKLVNGANHGFSGYERKLESIARWMKNVL